MSIYLIAIVWVSAIIITLLALNGWFYNIKYFMKVCLGVGLDVACQLWIDISKLWQRRKAVDRAGKIIDWDETERFYH